MALAVAGLLTRDDPMTLRRACVTLRQLGSTVALEVLVELLGDEDQDVAREAWTTLRALTGQDLPLQAESWQEALLAGPRT
jgi:HEAT repeat protein